jgi:GT2 family glycosyltransferase
MDKLQISIVLPTYNRRAQLEQVLLALGKQTVPLDCFEVIVVSDGSVDGTNGYLEEMVANGMAFELIPISQANQGVAAARNTGIARARADFILFIDDDVVPIPKLIAEHWRVLSQDNDVVVLGPMLTPPGVRLSPWVRWEQTMLEKQYQSMIEGRWSPTARQFYTGNTSLAKRHLEAAGGFDPAFRRAEDVELAYRLKDRGLRFIFNPQAIGYHYAERSFASWSSNAYAYGRNDVIMTYQKGQDWLLPTVLEEFPGRHPLVRILTRLCLGQAHLSRAAVSFLCGLALLGDRLNIESLPRFAYSGIFNLRHYQGIADELGGAAHFWKAINHV